MSQENNVLVPDHEGPYTVEEIAERIADWFFVQRKPKSRAFFVEKDMDLCAYRGEKGRACMVGCLIPDSVYHSSMECKEWSRLVEDHYSSISTLFPDDVLDLLCPLQVCHDDADSANFQSDLLRRIREVEELDGWAISPEIMGRFLTAFETSLVRQGLIEKSGGELRVSTTA